MAPSLSKLKRNKTDQTKVINKEEENVEEVISSVRQQHVGHEDEQEINLDEEIIRLEKVVKRKKILALNKEINLNNPGRVFFFF